MDIKKMNADAVEIYEKLRLDTKPIGVKFVKTLEEIPEGAVFPRRDLGAPIAYCQATALARVKEMTVAMGKQDNWCWCPIAAMGFCESDEGTPGGDLIIEKALGFRDDKEKAKAWWANFPKLPTGVHDYVILAPLDVATFEPDVCLVYSNTLQVVWELGGIRFKTGDYVHCKLDSIDSCVHSVVEPILDGQYKVTFPDPGERARALAREDEVIVSMPGEKFEEFCDGIRETEFMYNNLKKHIGMVYGGEVPPFYHELFGIWGIDPEY